MTQETSKHAYKLAIESGLVSRLRLKVFEVLCQHSPMTANECRQYLQTTNNSGVYSTRFSELERQGLIYSKESRACQITGYKAMVWEITGSYPHKLAANGSKKQIVARMVKRIDFLKGQLVFDLHITQLEQIKEECQLLLKI